MLKLPSVLFATCCLNFLLVACKSDPIIWSTYSFSPDKLWLAHAYTIKHSGLGTAGTETIVQLELQSGLRDKIRVLAFSDGGDLMNLKMTWLSPSSLRISYADDPATLYFQVVKTSGIDIAVEDLDPQPAKGRSPVARPPSVVDHLTKPE